MAYRRKRGSLNAGLRAERGSALLAMMYANVHRDRKRHPEPFTLWDFTPHEEEPPISLEAAMESWK